jgi:tryptophan-rich sensory protein
MILRFQKNDPLAAYLQIPYLIWLTFAAYLNLGVWHLNR